MVGMSARRYSGLPCEVAGNPMLVTDAMPPVGGSKPSFQLYGTEIRVEAGRCLRADGTLAGAALDMATAVRNCVNLLQVSLPEALRFASWNPAEFHWIWAHARPARPGVPGRYGGHRSGELDRSGDMGGGGASELTPGLSAANQRSDS